MLMRTGRAQYCEASCRFIKPEHEGQGTDVVKMYPDKSELEIKDRWGSEVKMTGNRTQCM